jgi:hypothetical protein
MKIEIDEFVAFIEQHNGINDKSRLKNLAREKFALTRDRSVFYCEKFAVRFSKSKGRAFGNTVLSLSNLRKFDHAPFFVCLVTPEANYLMLANSTFLKKISHSSEQLRFDNIRGSFNGSDIVRAFNDMSNESGNFEALYNIHAELGFEENLPRLVEATNAITPTGKKFEPDVAEIENIMSSPQRAEAFTNSTDFSVLKADLDERVNKFQNEIIIAGLIENVNIRGRIIEYLIAGENDQLRSEIISALQNPMTEIPAFKTKNAIGDYSREFSEFLTETDIKTKIMVLNSNPKAYNIDKILEFLSSEKSIFLFFFVGIDPEKITNTALVSIFQTKLLERTIVLRHWAGRNSRGVTQFEGQTVAYLLQENETDIDRRAAETFLADMLKL